MKAQGDVIRFIRIATAVFWFSAPAFAFDCLEILREPLVAATFSATQLEDFAFRDSLPQTDISPNQYFESRFGTFGPCPQTYPQVEFPVGADRVAWSRERVLAAAHKWIGLPYKHYHFPAMGGMDCSNLTAFAYNYALGIRFTSNVERQAETAGRRLSAVENLQPGDLLFHWSEDGSRISHAYLHVDENTILDSTGPGIAVREFSGRYRARFAWARRVIE